MCGKDETMRNHLIVFTKLLLDIMFFAGIVVTFGVPFIIYFYGRYNTYFGEHMIALSIIFILSGIFAVLIIYELRRIFSTVLNNDCFIRENVTSLNRMGTYGFCIALITCTRLFVYLTPAVLIIILTFVIAGLFSKVLSLVFDKAVSYKLENDLTI